MDMAEKDDTEGRCPACRAPYDKEKIVGMAAKCERLVAEINMERKIKSQKAKTKSSEVKKQQLSSVRVIQRNLVYIVGLPLNLGDEELLQRREYFGQYGKVLKVSMSRTAAGVIQQFPNNTCSVYITYSKEEEAIRCIQSVHGFVLEGKSLKACFGTTKYCHAWLRNVPCTNPDCLYLHEIGSQEDSFTKDEIISAYTRVQQITGTTNNLQRRSGNLLPPPFDDYCHSSTASAAKPTVKNASNQNAASIIKDSTPNGSSGRPVALPAAASWGMRASNQQPLTASACSNGSSKQKPETVGGALAFSSAVANSTLASALHGDVAKMPNSNEDSQIMYTKGKSDSLKPLKQNVGVDCRTSPTEIPATPNVEPTTVSLSNQASSPPLSKYNDKGISMPPNIINSLENTGHSCASGPEKEGNVTADVKLQRLCSDMSAVSIDRSIMNEHSGVIRSSSSLPDHDTIKSTEDQGLQQYYVDQSREPLSPITGKLTTSTNDMFVSKEQFDRRTEPQTQSVADATPQEEEDILSFDSQRLKDPEVVCRSTYLPNSANSLHVSNHSRSHSLQHNEAFSGINLNADPQFVDNKIGDGPQRHSSSISLISNGYPEKLARSSAGSDRSLEDAFLVSNEGKGNLRGGLHGDADVDGAVDAGENSIISNILSMDFDTWDDPLALPQDLAKLLGETEKEPSSLKMSGSWKGHNNNQSRFSFARQEESRNHAFDVERSFSAFSQLPKNHSFGQNFVENREPFLDKIGIRNGFYPSSFEETDNFTSNPSVFPANKLSTSRSQISAPPGFSVPSRAPPPGFSSHERADQSFDSMSGNHILDSPSLLRNTYQTQPAGNLGSTGDIEFMDPAILAVGKGRLPSGLNNPSLDIRSNFPTQLSAFENEARLQLMMERSLSPHQNLRYANIGDSFSSLGDSYGISPRLMDQTQMNNISPFAQLSMQQSRNSLVTNGHWDGWNEVQGGNSLGMAELLRNDRLGFNKFYTGYEDSKFRMPSSGDLYNRTFGM
ncbi:RNA binding (RRM/RBD/RNP motifs) family protein [Melia azedarach]|uniref:RNA binding (RRM/RBD/RNP motifs) family protein n=1 Tax=Melia azedarach TaxID=155640 RepID=A0ACC1YS07_MELAZ|nr:RNA binding (RRM/RBD/RNP motifs) family protein [Melia azedarach]